MATVSLRVSVHRGWRGSCHPVRPSTQAEPSRPALWGPDRSDSRALHLDPREQARSTGVWVDGRTGWQRGPLWFLRSASSAGTLLRIVWSTRLIRREARPGSYRLR
jgi:hypothetical protein